MMSIRKRGVLAATLAIIVLTGSTLFATGMTTKTATTTSKPKTTAKPAATPAPAKGSNTQPQGRGQNGFAGRGQTNLTPILDKLVKAKTITTAQKKKIIAYQDKKNAARQAEMAKLQKMTDEQRQAYFNKQNKSGNNFGNGQRQSQFSDLVKNKTITQKQADAIDQALAASRPNFGNRQNQRNGQTQSSGQANGN